LNWELLNERFNLLEHLMLFETFPDIEKAYRLSQELSWIFNSTKDKICGFTRLARWADKIEQTGFKSFNTVLRTINIHHKKILNYFDNKSTNASAESFNAKIKAFRSQFRDVGNINFFLFRLTNLLSPQLFALIRLLVGR